MLYRYIQQLHFAYPWVLFALPLLVLLVYRHYAKKQQASLKITTTFFLPVVKTYKTLLRPLPFWCRILALAALILALARPQKTFSEEQYNGEGIDIVLCFDVSGSMGATDFIPNRLACSKEVANSFVQNRKGDRIGVTIFTSQSYTMCPLTTDYNTVLQQIKNIETGYLEDEGTAIGSGLATSVDRLRNSKTKSKIIILLTDGVDFGGQISPDVAKDMAKAYGIKIYAIGIGSNKEIDVQVQNEFGTTTQKRKMEFNETLLQQLATQTGGQYFQATDKQALEHIYETINQLEKSKIEVVQYKQHTEQFQWFVFIALALTIIDIVLRLTLLKKFP